MLPRTLTLLTTYQCTAACDHCCFHCSPRKKGRIPQHLILSYIDQAAEMPSVVNVVFSGGECFLLGDDLTAAINRAAQHGLATRCVTNAYWAVTPEAARRRLQLMVDAGLKELNISTGDFHLEYIPVDRIENAAVAAYESGLGLVITVEYRNQRSFTAGALLKDTLIGEIHLRDPNGMQVKENVWIPLGGNCEISLDNTLCRSPVNRHLMHGCNHVLTNMVITPDGDFVPCCGLTMAQIPDLRVGNASPPLLRSMAALAQEDLVKIWIRIDGPERIVEFLEKKDPSIRYAWKNVHPCQTCRDLFSREDLREAVRRYACEKEAELLLRYSLWDETDRYLNEVMKPDGAPSLAPTSADEPEGITVPLSARTQYPLSLLEETGEAARVVGANTFVIVKEIPPLKTEPDPR